MNDPRDTDNIISITKAVQNKCNNESAILASQEYNTSSEFLTTDEQQYIAGEMLDKLNTLYTNQCIDAETFNLISKNLDPLFECPPNTAA